MSIINHHSPAIFFGSPDDNIRELKRDWHHCPECNELVRNDSVGRSVCLPEKAREWKRKQRIKAKQEIVKARMTARELKFSEAQQRDEEALYQLEREYHLGRR
jgi:adenine-specific DNA methylase